MSDHTPPILTGDLRTDRALLNLARILAEIARNPEPSDQDSDDLPTKSPMGVVASGAATAR